MPRKPSAPTLDQLLGQFEPRVAAAFRAAVADVRAQADMAALVQALQRHDVDAALAALHLEPAAYSGLTEALRQAYTATGLSTSAALPAVRAAARGALLVFRFDGTNPVAERWLTQQSSTLVTRILEDQRLAVRNFLTEGMGAGVNPRETALNIIGRLNRDTGAREGGIIGLTSPQEEYLRTARRELASGDPEMLRNYLTRVRRDHRFDSAVMDAIESGGPVSGTDASRMLTSYSNRLLQLRGETLAKSETFTALETARNESYRQAEEKSGAVATKMWVHLPSAHPRAQHVQMNRKVVRLNEPFILPDGTQMQFPHDPSAPAKHTINCLCQADYRLDFLGAKH